MRKFLETFPTIQIDNLYKVYPDYGVMLSEIMEVAKKVEQGVSVEAQEQYEQLMDTFDEFLLRPESIDMYNEVFPRRPLNKELLPSVLEKVSLEERERIEIELEQEDGTMVYEVKFETASDEYKVYINAKDGTIFVKDEEDNQEDDEDNFPTEALTSEAVLDIIATELGMDITLFTNLKIEQDMDNGVAFYEIEFDYEGMEYELEVDALTGEIYSNSMDESGFDHQGDDDMDHDDDTMDYDDDNDDDMDVDDDDDEVDRYGFHRLVRIGGDKYVRSEVTEIRIRDGVTSIDDNTFRR